jgi:small conductance mechanosensitive channel
VFNLFGLKKWLVEKIRSESVSLVVGMVGFFIVFLIYEIWTPYFKTVDTLLIKKVLIIAFYLFSLRAVTRFIKLGVEQFVKKRQQESIDYFRRDSQRQISLAAIASYVLNGLVLFLTTLIVFDNLGINLGALLATAGVASLAIGFGAQSLIKDFIHGFYILWEDQFAVGDVVQVNQQVGGEVVRMTLRITQFRNPEGILITVPNGSIDTVENMSNEWSRIDWRLGVAYDSDIRHVFKVIEEVLLGLKKDFPLTVLAET